MSPEISTIPVINYTRHPRCQPSEHDDRYHYNNDLVSDGLSLKPNNHVGFPLLAKGSVPLEPLGDQGKLGPLSIPPLPPFLLEGGVARMVSPQPPRPSSSSPVVPPVPGFGDTLLESVSRTGWNALTQTQKFQHVWFKWCFGGGTKGEPPPGTGLLPPYCSSDRYQGAAVLSLYSSFGEGVQ